MEFPEAFVYDCSTSIICFFIKSCIGWCCLLKWDQRSWWFAPYALHSNLVVKALLYDVVDWGSMAFSDWGFSKPIYPTFQEDAWKAVNHLNRVLWGMCMLEGQEERTSSTLFLKLPTLKLEWNPGYIEVSRGFVIGFSRAWRWACFHGQVWFFSSSSFTLASSFGNLTYALFLLTHALNPMWSVVQCLLHRELLSLRLNSITATPTREKG